MSVCNVGRGFAWVMSVAKIELLAKKARLRGLIRQVGHHYKATPEEREEMYEDTLKYHDIDVAIKSFINTLEECLKMRRK